MLQVHLISKRYHWL